MGFAAVAGVAAGIEDMDFLGDLSLTLLPHLSGLGPQQLAAVSAAFAVLGYSNEEFVNALAQKVVLSLPAFSARQLAKAVYGLGTAGCTDTRALDCCCTALQQRLHALSPGAITQALMGLYEAEYLSHRGVPLLLTAVGKKVEFLFAEDCVQLLLLLSKVPAASAGQHQQLQQQLQQQLHKKLRSHWCLDCRSLCDLLQALLLLRLQDPQLLELTMRRLAFLLQGASSREFLRLLGCFAALQQEERLLLRTHIHRRLKIQAAVSTQLQQIAAVQLDADSTAALLFACAQIGFADEAFLK